MKLITVEEHYMSSKVNDRVKQILLRDPNTNENMFKFVDNFVQNSLISNLGDERIAYMDEAGIDTQVISLAGGVPSTLDAKYSVPLCREVNDEMAELTAKYPGRFVVFANLPLADGNTMAEELERCVKEKHSVGAMLSGHYHGVPYDDPMYEPLFARAEELDVPIYLHPGLVDQAVSEKYYKGSWSSKVQFELAGYGIGWHYDVGIQTVRLILSGLFDRHPNLKIIIGHWGEVVAYYIDRLDEIKQSDTGLKKPVSRYFEENIYVNPSGMTYDSNFRYCLERLGADHILWGEDYPYRKPENIRSMLEEADIPSADKEKIAHGNAERILKLN